MDSLYFWLLIFFVIWVSNKISEDKKNANKIRRKENNKARAKNKKIIARNDQIFIGMDEGYIRESVPYSTRKLLLNKGKVSCHYCGLESTNARKDFHLDHIIPVTRGGTSEFNNLIPSCPKCNQEKTNYNPIDYIIFKYLRDYKITNESLQYLQNVLVDSLNLELKNKNKKWWESRVKGIEAFLDFHRRATDGSGETTLVKREKVNIFTSSRWGGTKLTEKEIYENEKIGQMLLVNQKHYTNYINSYIPNTNSQMLIARIPCLVIKDKGNLNDQVVLDSFRFYGLEGGEIDSFSFGEKSELAKKGIELGAWDVLREMKAGYLTEIWYSRILRRELSTTYRSGMDWISLKNGGYMRKSIDVMLTIALPKKLTMQLPTLNLPIPNLEQALVGPLVISMDISMCTPSVIDQVNKILESHPGDREVHLQLKDGQKSTVLKLDEAFKVKSSSSLFDNLKTILGPDCLSV